MIYRATNEQQIHEALDLVSPGDELQVPYNLEPQTYDWAIAMGVYAVHKPGWEDVSDFFRRCGHDVVAVSVTY